MPSGPSQSHAPANSNLYLDSGERPELLVYPAAGVGNETHEFHRLQQSSVYIAARAPFPVELGKSAPATQLRARIFRWTLWC
jgi:hypothetical protein